MKCCKCSCKIEEDGQYYIAGDMGPEIISILEQIQGKLFDASGVMCSQCFSSVMKLLPKDAVVSDEDTSTASDASAACAWCARSVCSRRCHSLADGPERQTVAENIFPRQLAEGALLCHRCWARLCRTLKDARVAHVPSRNTFVCALCARSLARTRRHELPAGAERDEVLRRIQPREVPPGGAVCYACWVAVRRHVRKAAEPAARPASAHADRLCALCGASLFHRRVRHLRRGPERDFVAQRIHPTQIPDDALLCSTCWHQAEVHVNVLDLEHPPPPQPTMTLEGYWRTPNCSRRCFVPSCANASRLSVPHSIRKRILREQRIFVTADSRICAEHKTKHVDDWSSLDKSHFCVSFNKSEMEAMMKLALSGFNL